MGRGKIVDKRRPTNRDQLLRLLNFPDDGGWCYMFRDKPDILPCGKYRLNEDWIGLRESITALD